MKMDQALPSIEFVHNVLGYDLETGIFTWAVSNSNRVKVGDRAGVIASNGRRYINVDGIKVMAHRLAWFYVTGEWPQGDVKQLDDDFDNCAWNNLELVSRSVASRKRALSDRNKSGFRGVSQTKSGRWSAFITREYKQLNLGVFDTPEEASAAYEKSASELESVTTSEQKSEQAEKASIRRRLRVAWKRLNEMETDHFFADYDEFVAVVKDVPARYFVTSIDKGGPCAPGNWETVADLSTGFDLGTRDGRIAYGKAHRQANPEQYRAKELRKNFNISVAEYDAMFTAQNGVCDICKKPETAVIRGKVICLSVDHDHETDAIRGLLCGHCNHAIGKFDDDVDLLLSAAAYLRKHAAPAPFVCDDPNRDWLHVATPGHPMVDLSFGA